MKKDNFIFIGIILVILIAVFFIGGKSDNSKKEELLTGKHYVEMDIKDYGKITLELDSDIAPITVTNFINLVNDKFYDGLTFHRIISGFMVQGGDPDGNGYGGSSKTIKGEFALNGVENNISHVRGVISMARNSSSYDSASSQFFIMHQDDTSLDGSYAAFGKVISGMEVVDELAKVEVEDDNGTVKKENQPIINKIKVIEKTDIENLES